MNSFLGPAAPFAALIAAAVMGMRVPAQASVRAPAARPRAQSHVLDLHGRPIDVLSATDRGPVVLVFTRTDCPIANRYAPELGRLRSRFARRGIAFWLVYVDGSEPVEAIERHAAEFGRGFGAVRDPEHELVRAAQATVTPEAAVFVRGANGVEVVYRGRIDDRYVDFGRARPAPTSRDLEQVLAALASGAALARRTTPAVGCFISAKE